MYGMVGVQDLQLHRMEGVLLQDVASHVIVQSDFVFEGSWYFNRDEAWCIDHYCPGRASEVIISTRLKIMMIIRVALER